MWAVHCNEVLRDDAEYQKAVARDRRVGRTVAWAYAALIGGLLAFCTGFYYWRFRFLWAFIVYLIVLAIAAFGLKTILYYSHKNDHLSQIVIDARERYINGIVKSED